MDENVDLKRLRQIIEQDLLGSGYAWWDWDILNNRVITNDRKVTMLGYDPDAFRDAGYQAFTDLLHPDDYQRTMQAMRDHLEGKALIYQVDYRIKRADGTYTWYMDRGLIIERTPEGRPARLRGMVIDLGPEIEKEVDNPAVMGMVRTALPNFQQGKELVSVCVVCKKLKLDNQRWIALHDSFEHAFKGAISHGICPQCLRRLYPEEAVLMDLDCQELGPEGT